MHTEPLAWISLGLELMCAGAFASHQGFDPAVILTLLLRFEHCIRSSELRCDLGQLFAVLGRSEAAESPHAEHSTAPRMQLPRDLLWVNAT